MQYAIVESGGKQYKAVEGKEIEVDYMPLEIGQAVELKSVLLTVNGEVVKVGTPLVKGATVKATIASHDKGPKLTIFKYSPKKRIRVKTGHRQIYTQLKIDKIEME